MNIGVHISFSIIVFSGYMPSNGIARSCVSPIFSFLSNLHTVLHSGYINLHPHQLQFVYTQRNIVQSLSQARLFGTPWTATCQAYRNGILLSHKRNATGSFREMRMDLRVCHTKWSKSEREKQISYSKAYMLNLEKWYRWTYFQGKNTDADVEHGCVDTSWGRGEWDKRRLELTYTLPCVKQRASGNMPHSTGISV